MLKPRHLALAGGFVLLTLLLAIAQHKYRAEQQLFFPKGSPVKLPAAASGVPGMTDVSFEVDGTPIHGWYVASQNRASVILTHGAGANRSQLVAEARQLQQHGFGVLLFDWPGHGESGGKISWNAGERAALHKAIDWLTARADVDPKRIGAYGFSMGGYVVSQVAASDQRLAAVVLAGTPADQRQQVHFQHGRLWLLGELPALLALKNGGMDVDRARPIDEIAKISPRAVLVIGGTSDVIVPPSMAPELYAKAGEPKQLLTIEGAGHGDYARVDEAKYLGALSAFFERFLLTGPG